MSKNKHARNEKERKSYTLKKDREKENVPPQKKKDGWRVEPVSGGLASSRHQSDKPLHHGPSLQCVEHFVFLFTNSWQRERAIGNPHSVSHITPR